MLLVRSMAELKDLRDAASASNATCYIQLFQMQKNFAAASEKVNVISARAHSMGKIRDAVAAKFEELHSSMEQSVGFAKNEMALLMAEIVKLTQKWDSCVAMTEQFLREVQSVLGLVDEAKKLLEHMSSLETAVRAKVSKDRKSPAPRLKCKKSDVEAEVEQARLELD